MRSSALRSLQAVLYIAAAMVSFLALITAGAQAAPVPLFYESPRIETLAGPALASITYPWQERLPGWTVEFVSGEGSIAGYTWSREERIEVFVRSGATSDDLARILAHELGHAVDVSLNSGDERREWLDARGVPDAPWWPGEGVADFATGAGDFAEAFAVWQVGASDYRGELADIPTVDQLDLLVELSGG